MTVLTTFQDLVEPRKLDADSLQQAMTVGWCVELVRTLRGRGQEEFTRVGLSLVGRGEKLTPWLFVSLSL